VEGFLFPWPSTLFKDFMVFVIELIKALPVIIEVIKQIKKANKDDGK